MYSVIKKQISKMLLCFFNVNMFLFAFLKQFLSLFLVMIIELFLYCFFYIVYVSNIVLINDDPILCNIEPFL